MVEIDTCEEWVDLSPGLVQSEISETPAKAAKHHTYLWLSASCWTMPERRLPRRIVFTGSLVQHCRAQECHPAPGRSVLAGLRSAVPAFDRKPSIIPRGHSADMALEQPYNICFASSCCAQRNERMTMMTRSILLVRLAAGTIVSCEVYARSSGRSWTRTSQNRTPCSCDLQAMSGTSSTADAMDHLASAELQLGLLSRHTLAVGTVPPHRYRKGSTLMSRRGSRIKKQQRRHRLASWAP
ncbi:hypothetical protein BU25DRAFT_60444 [Macroventuria anomochaeta]|uniref:Uncharacterized protein n=1 Tax=Macroventuria anomochaeta TaxID=301207 RepID=A0ACB6RZF5_9PLEO|nr:uncharacterized protein BU25DRAFT_60444 [Macroventuria anomochaeta]KAF2627281.1 hypothetical protein BU25DRAFT_60444 [Macroventuria anomochaeta]